MQSLSPGTVYTEIFTANGAMSEEALNEYIKNREDPILISQDIADAILYLLSTPLRVQVIRILLQECYKKKRFWLILNNQ